MLDKDMLIREGAQARAVVLSATRRERGTARGEDSAGHWELRLRVQFDDGSSQELVRRESDLDVGADVSQGDFIPMRYDPQDRSNIAIDILALKAQMEAAQRTSPELTGTSPELGLDDWHPIDRLRRLNDLHDHGLLSDTEFAAEQAKLLRE